MEVRTSPTRTLSRNAEATPEAKATAAVVAADGLQGDDPAQRSDLQLVAGGRRHATKVGQDQVDLSVLGIDGHRTG